MLRPWEFAAATIGCIDPAEAESVDVEDGDAVVDDEIVVEVERIVVWDWEDDNEVEGERLMVGSVDEEEVNPPKVNAEPRGIW